MCSSDLIGDDHVRDEHRVLDGVIRPLKDDFWKTHYPPNGWGCRCTVLQTDDEPKDLPDSIPKNAKGFNQNVGQTGKLFGDDHPYFANMEAATKDRIFQKAELTRAKDNRDNVKSSAKEKFIEPKTAFNLPELDTPISITGRDLDNMISHFHEQPAIKDSIVSNLDLVLPKARYVTTAPNLDVNKPFVDRFMYYLWEFNDVKFFFNIKILIEGGVEIAKLYAINNILR